MGGLPKQPSSARELTHGPQLRGPSGLNLELCPAGAHTCPPSAPQKLCRILGQPSWQQDPWEASATTRGLGFGCTRGERILTWIGLEEHILQWVRK